MQVTVLFGGPSAEREISLISGRAVIEALRSAGHDVFASDIAPDNLAGLAHPADVVFPVLHGAFGESGELQEILEQRGLPFVGSGSVASRTGMNKDHSKRAWQRAGLPIAAHEIVFPVAGDIDRALNRIGVPCVIKPVDSGSSIDVFICRRPEDFRERCAKVLAAHGTAMVERFIQGIEMTVGILEERPLSPIRITTSHEFFDYAAKYVGNDAQHHFDTGLPPHVIVEAREIARRAHQVLGCRDLSRVDLIVDGNHQPQILEINTLPGFTPKSLLPEAAAHDGVPFAKLVDRLVCRAYQRGAAKLTRKAV